MHIGAVPVPSPVPNTKIVKEGSFLGRATLHTDYDSWQRRGVPGSLLPPS